MRPRPAAVLLTSSLLVACFWLLAAMGSGWRARLPPASRRVDAPAGYLDWVGSRNEFQRVSAGGSYLLQYGFIDHQGKTHRVIFRIGKADHERENARFGYDEAEIGRAADSKLEEMLQADLQSRGLAPYIQVSVSSGRLEVRPQGRPPDASRAWLERVADWQRSAYENALAAYAALRGAAFKEHGLLMEGNTLRLDYAQIADWSTPALKDCFRSLHQSGQGYDHRQYLGLFLAFFQEIRYVVPPDIVGQRNTMGLWVPTEVVVNNHGDCDSKSVAFCALWRNFGSPMLVIRIPGHVLVGVSMAPGPGQQFVRLGNRYFIFCEVAGPGKLYPGEQKSVSGHFSYTLIEPVGDEGLRSRRGESGS